MTGLLAAAAALAGPTLGIELSPPPLGSDVGARVDLGPLTLVASGGATRGNGQTLLVWSTIPVRTTEVFGSLAVRYHWTDGLVRPFAGVVAELSHRRSQYDESDLETVSVATGTGGALRLGVEVLTGWQDLSVVFSVPALSTSSTRYSALDDPSGSMSVSTSPRVGVAWTPGRGESTSEPYQEKGCFGLWFRSARHSFFAWQGGGLRFMPLPQLAVDVGITAVPDADNNLFGGGILAAEMALRAGAEVDEQLWAHAFASGWWVSLGRRDADTAEVSFRGHVATVTAGLGLEFRPLPVLGLGLDVSVASTEWGAMDELLDDEPAIRTVQGGVDPAAHLTVVYYAPRRHD